MNKTIASFIIAASALFFTNIIGSEQENLTGKQIFDEILNRHEISYASEKQTMTLIDSNGNEENRKVHYYLRTDDDGGKKSLIIFENPSGIRGVALLNWSNKDKEDRQWIYLPAYGNKMKRIAKGGKRNYFMGTNFAYEDLSFPNKDNYQHKRLEDENIDGKDYFVVEISPNNDTEKKESGYSLQRYWIEKERFIITQISFFNRRGKFFKKEILSDFKNISGNMWLPSSLLMENIKEKHSTVLKVLSRGLSEESVPESYFQQRFIISGKYLRTGP